MSLLKSYVTVAIRNLSRSPLYSGINIGGLAIGLAACIVILLYVRDQLSYDRFLPNADEIWRIDSVETVPGRTPIDVAGAPAAIKDLLLTDFPEIADAGRMIMMPFSVARQGAEFKEQVALADENFFDIIRLPFAAGTAERALGGNRNILLSEAYARKYFGTVEAAGKTMTLLMPEPRNFQVAGVFHDIPQNSHLAFDMVIRMDRGFSEALVAIMDNWGNPQFKTYIRLHENADPQRIQDRFPAFLDRHFPADFSRAINIAPNELYQFNLIALRDLYFDGAPNLAMKAKGDRKTVIVFALIAFLILVIAAVNFVNLTTARAALRAREVGVRKVMGARRRHLVGQFLLESGGLAAVALVLALGIVELTLPGFRAFFAQIPGLNFFEDPALIMAFAGLALVVGLGAGLYPAFYLSSFRPSVILQDANRIKRGRGRFRSFLVVAQFSISIALMIAVAIIYQQTHYAVTKPLGYQTENIMIVRDVGGAAEANKLQTFIQRASRHPAIVSVGHSLTVPSDPSEANATFIAPGQPSPVAVGFQRVGHDFFETYEIAPLAGRVFSEVMQGDGLFGAGETAARPTASVVLNEKAVTRLGFATPDDAIGKHLQSRFGAPVDFTIVGVIPDIHYRSLYLDIRDEIYLLDANANAVSLRYNPAELPAVRAHIDQIWKDLFPERTIAIEYLGDNLLALYETDRKRGLLLAGFAFFALFVSSLGLFGLTAAATEARVREVALRKVLGSTNGRIIRMLVLQFSRPVLIANLIAWPTAWYFMRDWLNGFAFRMDLTPAPFIIAGVIAFLIAWITVAGHAIRVSRTNPAIALRYE